LAEHDGPVPSRLRAPALVDTGVWSWARDRRFPQLAEWFNKAVADGLVLTCELVVIELTRATANGGQASVLRERLAPFERVAMTEAVWAVAAEIQLALSATGDHRRVPPADLLIAAAAIEAGVPLLHYDRDYERIAGVSELQQVWFVGDGELAG
jgi:predicted nucleic acid-binding protein